MAAAKRTRTSEEKLDSKKQDLKANQEPNSSALTPVFNLNWSSKRLEGLVFRIIGKLLTPLDELTSTILNHGGLVESTLNDRVTHLIVREDYEEEAEYQEALKRPIYIVEETLISYLLSGKSPAELWSDVQNIISPDEDDDDEDENQDDEEEEKEEEKEEENEKVHEEEENDEEEKGVEAEKEKEDEEDENYITEKEIHDTEEKLGKKLPAAYIRLVKSARGRHFNEEKYGLIRPQGAGGDCADWIPVTCLLPLDWVSIDEEDPAEYPGFPEIGPIIAMGDDEESYFILDYRQNGPQAEPRIVYWHCQMEASCVSFIARNFEDFLCLLKPFKYD